MIRSPIFSRHVRVCCSCSWSDRPSSGLSSCFRAFFTGLMRSLHFALMEQSLLLRQPFDFSGFILNGTKKGETHNAEGLLVEFVVLFPLDGDGLRSSCDVDWTLSLLPFGCFSLTDKKRKRKKRHISHHWHTKHIRQKDGGEVARGQDELSFCCYSEKN